MNEVGFEVARMAETYHWQRAASVGSIHVFYSNVFRYNYAVVTGSVFPFLHDDAFQKKFILCKIITFEIRSSKNG